eukprot:3842104-Alexandrium_andersonii.AAC.1
MPGGAPDLPCFHPSYKESMRDVHDQLAREREGEMSVAGLQWEQETTREMHEHGVTATEIVGWMHDRD